MAEPTITEIKDLVDGLAGAFEAHKKVNDQRLDDITKKGASDPLDEEQVKRISEGIDGLQDKMQALDADRKAAEEAKAAAEKREAELNGRLDGLEVTLKRTGQRGDNKAEDDLEKKSKLFWADDINHRKASRLGVEETVETYEAYCKAFAQYIRIGAEVSPDEQKALSVAIEADGGYWVTPEMAGFIVQRTFETSAIRSIARVLTVGTDALEYPQRTNKFPHGGWVGESDSRAETTTPQIGMGRIAVHEHYANPAVRQKLLDDAVFDVEGWVAAEIADEFARQENTEFVTGNGVAKPRGFLDYSTAAVTTDDASRAWGVLQYVFTGKSAAFDTDTVDATASPADELVDIQSKLKNVYRANARWVMNRATEAEVRKLRNTTGEYLVTMNTGNITGVPLGSFTLLGHPIMQAEDMPDIAADSFSIAFGDFSRGYLIVDRMGIRTLRDPFTSKGSVLFYTTKRVGADVIDFDSIKLLKFGTS